MLRAVIALAFLCPAAAYAESNYEAAKRLIEDGRAKRAAAQDDACKRLGGVRIGMPAEAVRKSCWGTPRRINTTHTGSGNYEQWVYGGGYVYLTNGVVTSVQTSR